MPAYKVPCPRCGQFIMRDVAVCPFCRTADPFAPARCVTCSTVLEDPRWTVCPQCGTEVPKVGTLGAAATAGAQPAQPGPTAAPGAQPSPSPAAPFPAPPEPAALPAPAAGQGRACSWCGAPLAAGARFCTVCGTIAG